MVLKKPERNQALEIGEQALVSDDGGVNAAKVDKEVAGAG
jgi:hypothetical protein